MNNPPRGYVEARSIALDIFNPPTVPFLPQCPHPISGNVVLHRKAQPAVKLLKLQGIFLHPFAIFLAYPLALSLFMGVVDDTPRILPLLFHHIPSILIGLMVVRGS